MTERTARIDQLLQEEISRIVTREVQDPRIGFATITRVETAPDLRHARVWVSLIGQPDERRATFRALARAMPFVRHELGVLRLRRIPQLHLELDDSVERGTRVLQILDDLEAGREPSLPEPGETLPTPRPAHVEGTEAGEGGDADGFGDAASAQADAAAAGHSGRRPRTSHGVRPATRHSGHGRPGVRRGGRAS